MLDLAVSVRECVEGDALEFCYKKAKGHCFYAETFSDCRAVMEQSERRLILRQSITLQEAILGGKYFLLRRSALGQVLSGRWEDGSVGKALADQAGGAEFQSPESE